MQLSVCNLQRNMWKKGKVAKRCAKTGSCIVKAVLKRNVSDMSYIIEEITNIPIYPLMLLRSKRRTEAEAIRFTVDRLCC